MVSEIERKFKIREGNANFASPDFLFKFGSIDEIVREARDNGTFIEQGYLDEEKGMELLNYMGLKLDFDVGEFRIREKGGRYQFTIKSDGGLVRDEFNFEIYVDVFNKYWDFTKGRRLRKWQIKKKYGEHIASFSVYGDLGLVIGEVEVNTVEEAVKIFSLGYDVTEDPDYKGKNLILRNT